MNNHPQCGHRRRGDFLLAGGVDHLNHGGYGATPQVVLDAARAWRARMEADPSTFFRRDLMSLVRQSADRVAAFLGGKVSDWAFVENATAGLNAVIASLRLQPGDEMVCLSQVYGAVGNALRYHAERAGTRVLTIDVPVPFVDPAPLLEAIAAAIGPRTRLACFDHIISAGTVVLPIREMAALCRERGVPVAVDGARAPGQIALEYLAGLGGEAVRTHSAALAREAGEMLIEEWNSEVAAAPEFCASMVSVRLPGGGGGDRIAARSLAAQLNEQHGITAGVMVLDGGLWIRVSAQIYNEMTTISVSPRSAGRSSASGRA